MMVLVDTPIWSFALRRNLKHLNPKEARLREDLAELILEGRAALVGPVRQELLSGIREHSQFDRLRKHLRSFEEPRLEVEDYEEAAQMTNQCRAKGIAGSAIDFLICAIAARRDWQVFTTDADFTRYARYLAIRLFPLNYKAR